MGASLRRGRVMARQSDEERLAKQRKRQQEARRRNTAAKRPDRDDVARTVLFWTIRVAASNEKPGMLDKYRDRTVACWWSRVLMSGCARRSWMTSSPSTGRASPRSGERCICSFRTGRRTVRGRRLSLARSGVLALTCPRRHIVLRAVTACMLANAVCFSCHVQCSPPITS